MKVNLLSAILNAFACGYCAGQGSHVLGWKALVIFGLMILAGTISGTLGGKVYRALDESKSLDNESDHK